VERVLAVVSNPAAKKMTPWAVMRSVGNFKKNLHFLCHFHAEAVTTRHERYPYEWCLL
jgi:hypothetical protein